jgi:hypothetical protein
MNGRQRFSGVLAILAMAIAAEAHLVAGSLSIKGGETFSAGSSVNVKWRQDAGHDGKYDFKFSNDGGANWVTVDEEKQMPATTGEITYVWTVPSQPTTQGQFRVCQLNGGIEKACDDATYMLKSPNFIVATGNSIRSATALGAGSLSYDARTCNLDISFMLAAEGEVLVQAFDASGRLIATLLGGRRPAGSHRVSVFSNRLEAGAPAIFRLTAGGKIQSLIVTPISQ